MHGVAYLLVAAAAGFGAARWLNLPAIPFLLIAGVGLSRIAPLPPGLLADALVLGASFLLFVVGLELDPRRMRAQGGSAAKVGSVQFLALGALGYATAVGLGYAPRESAYLAVALTASSTLVGVRLLQRRQQMFEPYGRLVLGVLLLQDLLVLLTIPLLTESGGAIRGVLTGFAGVGAIALLTLSVRRWIAPWFLRVSEDSEALLLSTLMVLFAFLAVGAGLGLPVVVGSFLAGVSLARFPVNGIVRVGLAPIGDFFTAVFFTALGALVSIPSLPQLLDALLFSALVVLVTVPLVAWRAERNGFSAKQAIEAGLLLSQTSEISLVIGLAGMLQGHLGNDVFTVIALVTLATMVVTPFLASEAVASRLLHLHPGRSRSAREAASASGHVVLLGAGSSGMPLLEDFILAGERTVVVDDDPGVVRRLEEAGIPTIRGDASDPKILAQAGVRRARAVCSTIRRPRGNGSLLEMAVDVPVLVRVFEQEDALWVRERGGIPVLYSEATADAVMAWYRGRSIEG